MTFAETDKSTVLSPTSTIKPPRISGLTSLEIFKDLPDPTNLEPWIAFCNLWMVLESKGFAEMTVASTTPLYAEFKMENCLAMLVKRSNLLFSDKTESKLVTIGSNLRVDETVEMTCFLESRERAGFARMKPNLESLAMASFNFCTDWKVLSTEESFAAAVKRAVA